ncbi:hypothetical protein VP01_2629g3 [Puccinia sorghi]|uniref:Uncharacterized protein n=1 Tax=Puccinia sorghi TaxID=27349 RepID=A0A0L6V670_9BASI|nr:hypothetical protein VP01_2629g3 [Puccinia sorghi]
MVQTPTSKIASINYLCLPARGFFPSLLPMFLSSVYETLVLSTDKPSTITVLKDYFKAEITLYHPCYIDRVNIKVLCLGSEIRYKADGKHLIRNKGRFKWGSLRRFQKVRTLSTFGKNWGLFDRGCLDPSGRKRKCGDFREGRFRILEMRNFEVLAACLNMKYMAHSEKLIFFPGSFIFSGLTGLCSIGLVSQLKNVAILIIASIIEEGVLNDRVLNVAILKILDVAILHHAKFDVKKYQTFLSLVSQAPFFCGLSQVLVGIDDAYTFFLSLTLANKLILKANILKLIFSHFYLSLFPDCIIWFQRLSHLCLLFFIYRFYDSRDIPSLLSEILKIIPLCSLLIFPSLQRISAILSIFNQMETFSDQCLNCIGLYNKKEILPKAALLESAQNATSSTPLKQTDLRPLKEKFPSHPPLMTNQTSQINIPIQPSSPRKLAAVQRYPPHLPWENDGELNCTTADLMLRPRNFQKAPGRRGLDSGAYTYNLLHNKPDGVLNAARLVGCPEFGHIKDFVLNVAILRTVDTILHMYTLKTPSFKKARTTSSFCLLVMPQLDTCRSCFSEFLFFCLIAKLKNPLVSGLSQNCIQWPLIHMGYMGPVQFPKKFKKLIIWVYKSVNLKNKTIKSAISPRFLANTIFNSQCKMEFSPYQLLQDFFPRTEMMNWPTALHFKKIISK